MPEPAPQQPAMAGSAPQQRCSKYRICASTMARWRRSAASICSVAAGEVVALLGANGAGKSTMLRTISGLSRPRSGQDPARRAQPIHRLPPARIVRLGIAHCPEGRRVFGSLTVAENLRLGAAARADRAGIRRGSRAHLRDVPDPEASA